MQVDGAWRRAREHRIRISALYDRAEHEFARSMRHATRNDAFFRGNGQSRADVLQAVLERVNAVFPDCQSTSITTVSSRPAIRALRYTTAASTGVASTADAAQYALEEGPCLEAVELDHVTVVGTGDLMNDDYPTAAWPRFAAAVQDLRIRSVISIGIPWTSYWTGPVSPNEPPVGAINLYATRPHHFLGKECKAIKLGVHIGARLTGADPAEVYDPPPPCQESLTS